MYDYSTKNESFILMYDTLRNQGIKNNKFFLWLNDPDLKGVDPYDKNLTPELKLKIQYEVMNNFWYYIREVIRIPESGGTTPFLLHKGNLAQLFCMELNLDIIEVLPRQSGKTIGAVCRYSWVYNYGTENTSIVFSNKQLEDSQLNIKRLKDMDENLPDYLRNHLDSKLDSDNLSYISINKNNNNIKALSTGRTPQDADKLGRGLTIPLIWFDEFAFLKYNSIIYASAAPALSKASESALKNGTAFGKLITTTPNDRDSDEGAYGWDLLENSVRFEESWYDKNEAQIRSLINKHSKNDFVFIQFDYKELGRDDVWFEKQKRNLNNDLLKIKRELLLEWTITNDMSPFSEEQLSTVQHYMVEKPINKIELVNGWYFNIYSPMSNMINKSWLLGIDLAGGLTKDFTVITIIDPLDKKIKGIFRSNTIGVTDIEILLEELIINFLPNAVLIPERNSIGITLIELILKNPNLRKNLYYETREVKGERKVDDPRKIANKKIKTKTKVYGINTTGSSRNIMINEILNYIINEEPQCLTAKEIYEELKTLQRKKNGKIEHADGSHDDSIMSYLIAMYAFLYGNNIKSFVKVTANYSGNKENPTNKSIRNNMAKFSDAISGRSINKSMQYMSNSSGAKLEEEIKQGDSKRRNKMILNLLK